jgi:hypothetical protein
VSGSTEKARSRRSTSRRTVAGSGRGSSFLKQALANSERTCAGTAALPCATDAPEHLPGTLTLLGLPPVQGVDQQVGVNQVTGGHPYPRLTPGPRRARPGHTGSLRGSGGTQLTGRPPPRSLQGLRGARPRKTSSASVIPSSVDLSFSARSSSSLMYSCFLFSYTSYTSFDAHPTSGHARRPYVRHPACPGLYSGSTTRFAPGSSSSRQALQRWLEGQPQEFSTEHYSREPRGVLRRTLFSENFSFEHLREHFREHFREHPPRRVLLKTERKPHRRR